MTVSGGVVGVVVTVGGGASVVTVGGVVCVGGGVVSVLDGVVSVGFLVGVVSVGFLPVSVPLVSSFLPWAARSGTAASSGVGLLTSRSSSVPPARVTYSRPRWLSVSTARNGRRR